MEIHPNYTGIGNNLQNDICILHLDTPLTLGPMVQKISIMTNESQSETRCLISGWGSKQVSIYRNLSEKSEQLALSDFSSETFKGLSMLF